MATISKSVDKLLKHLRKKGWVVVLERNRHWRVWIQLEGFKSSVLVSCTPSDRHAFNNVLRDFRNTLKAAGYDHLDNYNATLSEEPEWLKVSMQHVDRLTDLVSKGLTHEELGGHRSALEALFNISPGMVKND